MSNDVSVIGLYILDVLGRPVERIPEGGAVEFIEQIRLTVAGTAGGTAVDCAKLGLKTLAVGAVGNDEKADFVIATLEKFGIDASGMQKLNDVTTSASILNVRANGERPALHARGASDQFDVQAEDYDKVFAAPIIHLGGTGLLAKLDGERSLVLLKEAKKRGKTVTFDLIAATTGTMKIVEPLLPLIDYFMPAIEEARVMSGMEQPQDCASFFLDRGATCCIVTLGEKGVYYAHADGTRLQTPAYDINVIDTTGCGDAFDAGYITALHHKMEVDEALEFAQASAALVATGLGSDAGIISFDDTLKRARTWPKLS